MAKNLIRTITLLKGIVLLTIVAVVLLILHHVPSKSKIDHVILISIDTCRADHLGCYGYPQNTTPNIDAVAEEGFLFENAIVPVPLTLPSHSSMLTGKIPPCHKVRDNNDYRLGGSNLTMAEILRDSGFATAAIVGSFVLDSQFGLDQGFDSYNDRFIETFKGSDLMYNERKGGEVSNFAIEWLQENHDKNFFMFLHYFDPHAPYQPPQPFAEMFPGNPYAGEIAYADDCVGQVIKKLKELNIYDSTLLIITADHGEGLGEHGEATHGFFLYNSTLKVPLIISIPGEPKGKKVHNIVGTIDILPTVCGLLHIPLPQNIQGRNLSPFITGADSFQQQKYYSESLLSTKWKISPLFSLTTDKWKYIQAPKPELYNLENDPGEIVNSLDQQNSRARIMKDELRTIFEENINKSKTDNRLSLDEETRNRLQSLGYVAHTKVEENIGFEQNSRDPKDFVGLYNSFDKLQFLISDKKYEQAVEVCKNTLAKWPGFSHTHHLMAQSLTKLGKYDQAMTHFSKALQLAPDEPNIYCNLANAFAEQGKLDDAIKNYYKALELSPDERNTLIALEGLAKAYLRQENLDMAIEYWSSMIRIKPDQPQILNDMGIALSNYNKPDEALEKWQASLKLEPDQPKVNLWLGDKYFTLKKIDKAIEYWLTSIALDPDQPIVHAKLGRAFLIKEQPGKTVLHWNKALDIDPDMPSLLNDFAWVLATNSNSSIKNPKKALDMALNACELTGLQDINFLDTLSVAYAANNDFPKAIETAEKAIDIAMANDQGHLTEEIKKHLELYKAGRQYSQ